MSGQAKPSVQSQINSQVRAAQNQLYSQFVSGPKEGYECALRCVDSNMDPLRVLDCEGQCLFPRSAESAVVQSSELFKEAVQCPALCGQLFAGKDKAALKERCESDCLSLVTGDGMKREVDQLSLLLKDTQARIKNLEWFEVRNRK